MSRLRDVTLRAAGGSRGGALHPNDRRAAEGGDSGRSGATAVLLGAILLALVLACAASGRVQRTGHGVAGLGPAWRGMAWLGTSDLAPITVCHIGGKLQMLCLHNWTRKQHGLPPLVRSSTLYYVAGRKADRIEQCGVFTHRPCGDDPFAFIPPGTFSTYGENLAASFVTVRAAYAAWLASPGHLANILNARFTQYGSGFRSSGPLPRLWVVEFARPLSQP